MFARGQFLVSTSRSRWRRLFVGLVACSLLLAACGNDDSDSGGSTATTDGTSVGDATPGGSLTYLAALAPPVALDNITAGGSGALAPRFTSPASYLYAIYGALVYEDYTSGEVVTWMADNLRMEDPAHWVLELRPDVTFTDGTPFDAEAVKYNWERIRDEVTAQQAFPIRATIADLTVRDPLTLDIELAEPNVEFDRFVARYLPFIGSPAAMEADFDSYSQAPVAAGPFVVDSFGDAFTLVASRNPGYWDQPRPYLDSLTIRFSLDQAQAYNTFRSGDAQLINGIGTAQLPQARSSDDPLLEIVPPGGGNALVFNTTRPPFDDAEVREAFQMAVDREAMNNAVNDGNALVQDSIFADDNPFYTPDAEFPEYDPGRAQEIFDEYTERTGNPVEIAYVGVTTPAFTEQANYLTAQMEQYDSVNFTTEAREPALYGEALRSASFDVAFFSWSSQDPQQDFIEFYTTAGLRNFGNYDNPEVDQLMSEVAAETDEQARIDLLAQVQDIIVGDRIAWFLWNGPNFVQHASNIQDLQYAVDGVWLWDRVWIES